MDYCTPSSPKSLLLELCCFPPAEERLWKPRQKKSPTFFITYWQQTAIRRGGDTVPSYWRTIIKVSIVLPYIKTWFSHLMTLVIFRVLLFIQWETPLYGCSSHRLVLKRSSTSQKNTNIHVELFLQSSGKKKGLFSGGNVHFLNYYYFKILIMLFPCKWREHSLKSMSSLYVLVLWVM